MAIKREKRQRQYLNEIGVNRGAGYAFAASQKQDQANAFDKIVDVIAGEALKKERKKGKKLAREAAMMPYVFEETENGVRVPVLPDIPKYLGATGQEEFTQIIYQRYEKDIKKLITNTVREVSGRVSTQGGKPETYKKEAQIQIQEILDNVSPNFEALMSDFAGSEIEQFEYGVITSYEARVRGENRIAFEQQGEESEWNRKKSIFTGKGDDPKEREKYILQLNNTDYTPDKRERLLREYDEAGKAFKYIYKNFQNEIFAKPSPTPKARNGKIQQNINQIIAFLETPDMKSIVINGKTYTSDDRDKFIKGDVARKAAIDTLKNYRDLAKMKVTQVADYETLQDYEDDFRKNWKNQDWQPTNTSTETKTKKILSDNNSHINHQYNVYATENGLEQFNGMYHDDIKKYYLRKYNMAPPPIHERLKIDLENNSISSTDSLSDILLYADFYKQYGYGNVNIKGMDKELQREALIISSLHQLNGFDHNKTLEQYQILVENRKLMSASNRIGQIHDQTFETQSGYFAGISRDILEADEINEKYRDIPILAQYELQTALHNYLFIADVKGSGDLSRNKLKDYGINVLEIILKESDKSNIDADNFIMGPSEITGNQHVQRALEGDISSVINPVEVLYGINTSDFIDNEDDPIKPDKEYSNDIQFIKDLLKKKLLNGKNGYIINTDQGQQFIVKRSLEDIRIIPDRSYLLDKRAVNYSIVFQKVEENHMGINMINNTPIENDTTGTHLILTHEEILEAREQYIKNEIERLEALPDGG